MTTPSTTMQKTQHDVLRRAVVFGNPRAGSCFCFEQTYPGLPDKSSE